MASFSSVVDSQGHPAGSTAILIVRLRNSAAYLFDAALAFILERSGGSLIGPGTRQSRRSFVWRSVRCLITGVVGP